MNEKELVIQEKEIDETIMPDVNISDLSQEFAVEPLPLYDEEDQYTEVLDFSHLNEEINKVEKAEELNKDEVVEINSNAEYKEESNYINKDNLDYEVKFEQVEPANYKIEAEEANEHPSAKISLKTTVDEEEPKVNIRDIKINIKDNKSLIFVIFIGIILLIAIFALPYFI